MSKENPERFVCPHCGSVNLDAQATAWWDEASQEWRFVLCDGADDFCYDCDTHVVGEFVPITDLKSAARVAIKQNEVV